MSEIAKINLIVLKDSDFSIICRGKVKATTGVSEAHLHLAGKPYVIGLIPSQS